MIEGIVAVSGVLVVVAWVAFHVRERGDMRSGWRNAARDAGLEIVAEKAWGQVGLVCLAGKHRVLIDQLRTRQGKTGTRVVIEGSSGITLGREGLGTAFEKTLGGREFQLGDDAFDREAYLRGTPEVLRALLDAQTREQLLRLLRGWMRVEGASTPGFELELSVSGGHLRADFLEQWSAKLQANLAEVLAALLGVARRLEPPADLAARIAENTRSEPEWRVRAQSLALLAERFPRHEATREALKRACRDESDDVRLRAAQSLKDEGRETLREIATREGADDACAATAVGALGEHLPCDAVLSILDDALRRQRAGTVLACLGALGRRGGPVAVERLARVLAGEAPRFSVAAARAMAATGEAAAEAPLLLALKDLPEVRTAAAEALGRVGSARAVLPLQEAAAHEDAAGQLQRAVRQSVAEIQSRLQGASPGQVSLAEGEAGQISLAGEDPGGRVSMANLGSDE